VTEAQRLIRGVEQEMLPSHMHQAAQGQNVTTAVLWTLTWPRGHRHG